MANPPLIDQFFPTSMGDIPLPWSFLFSSFPPGYHWISCFIIFISATTKPHRCCYGGQKRQQLLRLESSRHHRTVWMCGDVTCSPGTVHQSWGNSGKIFCYFIFGPSNPTAESMLKQAHLKMSLKPSV